MCRVKTGKNIKNLQDVQNLIIGIINRQEGKFDKSGLFKVSKYYLKESSVNINESILFEIIDKKLNSLSLQGKIKRKNSYYIPNQFDDIAFFIDNVSSEGIIRKIS